MKSLVLGLLLFVLSFPCGARAQAGQSDVERLGLKGRVKSLELWRVEYTVRDGASVEARRRPIQRLVFDGEGRKVEEVSYDQNGKPSAPSVHVYKVAGKPVDYDAYRSPLDRGPGKPRWHVHVLDGAGRQSEYIVYDPDGGVSVRFEYRYDAAGNKTEEESYSWNGARTSRLVHTYDERGNLLTQTSYNADDSLHWKHVHVYDAEGRKAESAQYQGETLRYKFLFTYDGKGRVKEEETREFNALPNVYVSHAPEPGRVVYAYDDERRTKEVATYDGRGGLKRRLRYSLDEAESGTGAVELNADGSPGAREIRWYDGDVLLRAASGTTSAEFAHDAQGNWTRRTLYLKPDGAARPEPYWGEQREIAYY